MFNKKIMIIGGTGALGRALVKRYQKTNEILVFSRDEHKQVRMMLDPEFVKMTVSFRIGDIRDSGAVANALDDFKPEVVINAAAMKHIHVCEQNAYESVKVNILGHQNLIECLRQSPNRLDSLVFVSTDKACRPINVYGMCKAISERLYLDFGRTQNVCVVRYGNVLDSTGSVIPLFKSLLDSGKTELPITDDRMTRFLINLDRAVDLIDWTYYNDKALSGISIPKIPSVRVPAIAKALFAHYGMKCKIKQIGIRPGEKLHEELISDTEWMRTIEVEDNYVITEKVVRDESRSFSSADCLIPDEKVYDFLKAQNVL